jgi:tetratricopeptide (TPR) repeat protein
MSSAASKIGRNEPCPCGSGKKYKNCCGAVAAGAPASALAAQNAQSLIDAADALRAQGRPSEAVPLYRRALEIDPHSPEAHNNLANALLELGATAEAAAWYRRTLTLTGEHAGVLCNLANTLRQLGQLEESADLSRRAIALDPKLAMAHNNLGLVLLGLGPREEAVGCFRRAVALSPNYVEALTNLGGVLRELGERREALTLYRRALDIDPLRASSHGNLGHVLFEMGRIAEAADCFRRAVGLQPDSAALHTSLAAAQRMQGNGEAAQASCARALTLDAKCVQALTLLGELHADRGQFSEAQGLFQRALAADPGFAFTYWSIANHRKMTLEDQDWLRGAEALLGRPQPLAQEVSLRFALGKYFDDVAHYDTAFAHYRAANELTKRTSPRYERAQVSARVERTIGSMDASFLREGRGVDSQLPVFVLGMPRSGTSLVEQILASHPAVHGAGELPFWDAAFRRLEAAWNAGEDGTTLLAGMARDYLDELGRGAGAATRVIDKMPGNFNYAGLIHAALPRARIIHVQRNPIDTCLSIYFHNFLNRGPYANDLANLAHFYQQYLRLTDAWRATLPSQALLEVPYEGLIEDQEGWTRRMLDFLGLPWDARCLNFQETERVVLTASKWQVRQKLNRGSAGRWRHYERHVAALLPLVAGAGA